MVDGQTNAVPVDTTQRESCSIGVDVGGTFTDVLVWWEDGRVAAAKLPSFSAADSEGLLPTLNRAVDAAAWPSVDFVLHGTTVGTNALLERSGGPAALVATRGFRDVLELGRRTRPQTYGLRGHFEPHIPRWHRYEVSERIDAQGVVVHELSLGEVKQLAAMIKRDGIRSIAVAFLHSYANDVHEAQVKKQLADATGLPITVSSEVLPEIKEFERTVATALNAYLYPQVSRYLANLEQGLGRQAPRASIGIMQSSGGHAPIGDVLKFPVRTVLSGPAAGVIGALTVAKSMGLADCITCDMGGTSFDVGIIEGGNPSITRETELDYNVPLRLPMVDIKSIGAGGGSVAWLDGGGLLHIGPRSARARPGPIHYGLGGRAFTVTDANVVSGRLQAATLGSDFHPMFNTDSIWGVVKEHQPELATKFGTAARLATAVIRVVNSDMAGAVREVTVRRGKDPRRYALIAFGGAGPMHAAEIARELGIKKVVVPSIPGLLSAYGCLVGPFAVDALLPVARRLNDIDRSWLTLRLADTREQLLKRLQSYGSLEPGVRAVYECHFERQSHSLEVVADLHATAVDIESGFRKEYVGRYGSHLPDAPVVVAAVRLEGRGMRRGAANHFATPTWNMAPRAVHADNDHRYWRPDLVEGSVVQGPATITGPDASIYVPEDATATVVEAAHIVMTV